MKIKINYFKLTPMLLLCWAVFSYFVLPIIPVASGFGWDGVFYGKVAMGFEDMAGKEIDSYGASRIFPSVLFYYFNSLFGLPPELSIILKEFRIFNIILLVLSSFLWIKISNSMHLSNIVKWVGFIALFINYPLINGYFYYPVNTGSTAFFTGLLILYAYLKRNTILLLLSGVIAFFSWPVLIVPVFIIFVFSGTGKMKDYYRNKYLRLWHVLLLLLPILVFLGLHFVVVIYELFNQINPEVKLPDINLSSFLRFNLFLFINGLLNAAFIVFIFWKILRHFDVVLFARSLLKRRIVSRFLIFIAFFVPLFYLKKLYQNDEIETFGLMPLLGQLFYGVNVRIPLQFLFSHNIYWGPSTILMIYFYKDILNYLRNEDVTINAIFLFTIMFTVLSESRILAGFFPLLVYLLLRSVHWNNINLGRFFIPAFFIISVLYSRIWFTFELPHTSFPEMGTNVYSFPMQWLFMVNGKFANTNMLIINAIISSFTFLAFYFFLKKGNRNIKLY